jgi:endonuclease/exonuclease/phosphatase family metal-dependent hydrolase
VPQFHLFAAADFACRPGSGIKAAGLNRRLLEKSVDAHSARARQAQANDPFAPIVVNRPAQRLVSPFKVVAFNALGCGDPQAVAERLRRPPLAGAAVILLSEADWGLRRSEGRQSVAELAELLGMSFAFSPEFAFGRARDYFTSFFGNAILSAAPLENVRIVPLQMFYDWTKRRRWRLPRGTVKLGQRGAVAAEISLGGHNMTLALAHLENRVGPEGRARQITQILGALPPEGPAVIGGDFNTTTVNLRDWRECAATIAGLPINPHRLRSPERYEPLFEVLERAGFEYRAANVPLAPTFTLTGLLPRFLRAKLDWIGLRALSAVPGSARVVPARRGLRRLSDHDLVVCEFTF